MKNYLTSAIIIIIHCFSAYVSANILPTPEIRTGIAKISGIIIDKRTENQKRELSITTYNLFSGEPSTLSSNSDENGYFELNIPVQTSIALAFLNTELSDKNMIITLAPAKESKLNIEVGEQGNINASLTNSPLNSFDILEGASLFMKMDQYSQYDSANMEWRIRYDLTEEEYYESVMRMIHYRIGKVLSNEHRLSDFARSFISKYYSLYVINRTLFHYSEEMLGNFRNTHPQGEWDKYIEPSQPGRAYYSFLKDIDLNDPQYLYVPEYSGLLTKILQTMAFQIPRIDETPIDTWLNHVKSSLKEIFGISSGVFYDFLVTNAYGLQFRYESIPLSDIQINNIRHYFRNNTFTDFLLDKNKKVARLYDEKNVLTVNEIPVLPDSSDVLRSIVSKHKGHIVWVDFWATWCAPCINAMGKLKEIKPKLRDKGVDFIYFADPTSSKSSWEKMIKGIGGEHYFLNTDRWNSISHDLDIKGIPFYLLYDREGKQIKSFVGYPGNDTLLRYVDEINK